MAREHAPGGPASPVILWVLTAVTALVALAGCGLPPGTAALPATQPAAPGLHAHAVDAPGRFAGQTADPDLLVYAPGPLADRTVRQVQRLTGVRTTLRLSVAQVPLGGRTLTVAAADPARFRRFTPSAVARTGEVWNRVAGGEVVVTASLGEELETPDGHLVLGNRPTGPRPRIAAYASLPPRLDAVLNPEWADTLGIPRGNALLVDAAPPTSTVLDQVKDLLGRRAGVIVLDPGSTPASPQPAVLTGGSVATAVGTFTYVPRADGTVVVDEAWVEANIRTEEVPILGRVTCHRVLLPQLRAALAEVVRRGLGDRIHADEYAGCFYPRYIGHDPARGLSLHSWGIAVDLNVPGNQRGTAGEIDRDVVAIFKRWGFAWGGDWAYSDPMHFELAAIVSAR